MAGKLIALHENLGVHPIGKKVVQRIIGRAILSVVKLGILEAASCSHRCVGQNASNEATVHAIQVIYGDSSTKAALLLDVMFSPTCIIRHCSSSHNIPYSGNFSEVNVW